MEITFFKASDFEQTIKCTIHKSGKLGFSEGAIKRIGIEEKKYIRIGKNNEDPKDENLYLIAQESDDEYCFKANRAGNYYYLNTRAFFDNLGFDYRSNSILFDIIEIESDGHQIFKLIRREKRRKKE